MKARTIAELSARFSGSGVHRLVTEPGPLRFVVTNTHIGWNHCDRCTRQHRVWVTTVPLWELLPRVYRKDLLCTRCYRELASWRGCYVVFRREVTCRRAYSFLEGATTGRAVTFKKGRVAFVYEEPRDGYLTVLGAGRPRRVLVEDVQRVDELTERSNRRAKKKLRRG